MYSTALFATLAAGFASMASAQSFDAGAKNNMALYWGQSSAGSEQSLGDYCESTDASIYVLSFLSSFGTAGPTLTVGDCDGTSCTDIAADIQKCQSSGKIVLLSLGGAAGSYGFTSDSQAEDFADYLWNTYGGGSADSRPFGDAVVDGFDLDIENNDNTGYVALVNQLRSHYNGASKKYYVSAAPQCVYPDANVGDALANAEFDFAFVQFYNNYCSIGNQFNYDTWENFAQNGSPNKDLKIFVGLPGSSSAAGSGYVDPDAVQQAITQISSSSTFGGIMMWDASQAYSNQVNGQSYASAMKNILDGVSGGSSSPAPAQSSAAAAPSVETSSAAAPSVSGPAGPVPSASGPAVSAPSGIAPLTGDAKQNQPTAAPSAATAAPSTSQGPANSEQTTTVAQTQWSSQTVVASTLTSTSTSTSATPSATPSGVQNVSPAGQPVNPSTVPDNCKGKSGQDLADCLNGEFQNTQGKQTVSNGQDCQTEGQVACQNGKFAMCNFSKWVVFECGTGTTCVASSSGDSAYVGCNWPQNQKRAFGAHHQHIADEINNIKL